MRIGVDLGGSKIEAIVLDGGNEMRRDRIATPGNDYQEILQAVCGLVESVGADLAPELPVGVGIPGALSPASGLIKNANTTCLIGKALDNDLAALLGRPVRIANDANCFTLSEAVDGGGAGVSTVFGVIIGTGTGGGLAVDQKVLSGANLIAGEWGHNTLPWPEADEQPGPECYCGQAGCIETFLSGPGLARHYKQTTGQALSAKEIVERAVGGDAKAVATLERYEDRLARSLATVINIFDPETVVLGGGLSNIDRLYENVPALWQRHTFSDVVTTRLVKAVHGDSSGVRGAAWLWPLEG